MDVDVHDTAIREIFASDPTLTRVVTGLEFGEGPVWDKRRKCLYFVDNIASKLHRWTPGIGVETVVSPTGHANGSTLDREGRLIVAGWSTRTVWRLEHDGTLATLASHFEGRKLNTPNDVIMRSDNSIYFTDSVSPRGQSIPMVNMHSLGRLLREGATVILDQANVSDPTMEVACRALQWWSHERVQVNAYLTTNDASGFPLHWDDHDVLIVQLAGEKEWEVRGTSRQAPMYRDADPNTTPSEEIVWSGVMKTGDVPRYGHRPIWLVRGANRHPGNDFRRGHEGLADLDALAARRIA